jgi:hypothetical protein
VTETQSAVTEVQTAATEVQTGATEALTAAEVGADVAGAPIELVVLGIAAAVAALALAAYEIYKNWKVIWAGMKAAVTAVWDWIKQNWPLLLSILLGPIAAAAFQIYKHWQDIKDGIMAVWDWLRSTWGQVENFLTQPITDAVNAIVAAFKAAFNTIADLWNGTIGSLSFKVPGWVPVLGGDKFSVPQIPHLAQGGLITETGLVFAHAGEAITPLNKSLGPAINIENAQFNEPVDIDLLVKRVEFALAAGVPV